MPKARKNVRFSDDSPVEPASPEKHEQPRRPPEQPRPRHSSTNGSAAKKSTKIKRTPKLLRSSYSSTSRESLHEERVSSEAKNRLSSTDESLARASTSRTDPRANPSVTSQREVDGLYWAHAFTNSDSDDTAKKSGSSPGKEIVREKRDEGNPYAATNLDDLQTVRREDDVVVCEERKSIEESSHILDSVSRSARGSSMSVTKQSSPGEKPRPSESMMKNLYDFATRSRSRAPIHDSVASNYEFVQRYQPGTDEQSSPPGYDRMGDTILSASTHSSHDNDSSPTYERFVRRANESSSDTKELKSEIVTERRNRLIDSERPPRISPEDSIYVEPREQYSLERETVKISERKPTVPVNQISPASSRNNDANSSKSREYLFREEEGSPRSTSISPDDAIYVEPREYHSLEKERPQRPERIPIESVDQISTASSRSSDEKFSKARENFFREETVTGVEENESKSADHARPATVDRLKVTKPIAQAQSNDENMSKKREFFRQSETKQEEAKERIIRDVVDRRSNISTRISPIEDDGLWRMQEYHFKKEGLFGSEQENTFVKERIPVNRTDRPYLKKKASSDDDVFESASDHFWNQESFESNEKKNSQSKGSVERLQIDSKIIPERSHVDDVFAKKREYFLQKDSLSNSERNESKKSKDGSPVADGLRSAEKESVRRSPDTNAFSKSQEHLVQKESYSDGERKESKLKDVQHFVAQYSRGVAPEYKRYQHLKHEHRSAADEYSSLENDLNHFRSEMKRLSSLISEGKRKLEKKMVEENERKVTRVENVYDFEVRLPMHDSGASRSPTERRSRSETQRDPAAGSKPLDRLQGLLKENWWSADDSKPKDGGPFSREQYEVLLECLKDLKKERSSSNSSFDDVIELLSKEVTKTVEYKSSDKVYENAGYHESSTDEQPKGTKTSSQKSDGTSSSYKSDSGTKNEAFDTRNRTFKSSYKDQFVPKSNTQSVSYDHSEEKFSDKSVKSSEFFEEKFADSSSLSYDYSSRKYSNESSQPNEHSPKAFRHRSAESDVYSEQSFVDPSKRLYEVPGRFADLCDRQNERYEQMFSDIWGKHAGYDRKFTDSWKYVDKDHFERRYGDESTKPSDRSKSSSRSSDRSEKKFSDESDKFHKSSDSRKQEVFESAFRLSDHSEKYDDFARKSRDAERGSTDVSTQSTEYSKPHTRDWSTRPSAPQPHNQAVANSTHHHSQYSPDSVAAGRRAHCQRSPAAAYVPYGNEVRSYSPPLVVTSRLLKGNSGVELQCPLAQTANNEAPSVAYPYLTRVESASSSATASPCASSHDVPKTMHCTCDASASAAGREADPLSHQQPSRPSYVSAVSYFVRGDSDLRPHKSPRDESAEQINESDHSSLPPPVNFATYPRSPAATNPPFSSVEYFTDERITKYEVGA